MVMDDKRKEDAGDLDNGVHQDAHAEADQPPAYDSISIHHVSDGVGFPAATSATTSGSSDLNRPRVDTQTYSLSVDKALPPSPSFDIPVITTPSPTDDDDSSTSGHTQLQPQEAPRQRKSQPWFSLLPFTSSRSAKQIRQSVLSTIHDLVSSPTPPNPEEILASCVELCAERKLVFSAIPQEQSVAEHTPIYWAIVNYREQLLVSLLKYARPLVAQTVSDIRGACLVSSNQTLFHALRVRRPPFHDTEGLQISSLRVASEGLLLGSRPSDKIHIRESHTDGAFMATFDIALWQRRMRTVGRASIEFIASGRIWCITFFSTNPPSSGQTRGKSKKHGDTWHIMVTVLDSSPPTFIDCQLVIEAPQSTPVPYGHLHLHPHAHTLPPQTSVRQLRQMRSASFTPSSEGHVVHHQDHIKWTSAVVLSPSLSPPETSLVDAEPLVFRMQAGTHKLARRVKSGSDVADPSESLSTKPEIWSEKGVSYTNAVVCSLGDGVGSHLTYENSRYLFADGTMRARLEARLVKTESSKDCIIC